MNTTDVKSTAVNNETKENVVGNPVSISFKAETQEILKIVSRSIYTNKEIFLRELISNASDATEQLRYQILKNPEKFSSPVNLEIHITTDALKKQIIIKDNGIGMTRHDLEQNLGTIAKSGSKGFRKSIEAENEKSVAEAIIGQFGVGFYSSFMVSDKVEVFTKSSLEDNAEQLYWVSDGKGNFEISNAENVASGTKIIVNLNEENKEFSESRNIEKIIKQFSNFVKFPIVLNGKKINLQSALWAETTNSVSNERYAEFFKYLTNAYDNPLITMHFHKDYPLVMQSLIFIPKYHSEKYGNARMKPGVHLYSRKVLIQKECAELVPDWLRFIKGVVDAEDLNLNISRESSQSVDTLRNIRKILVKKVIADLKDLSKSNPALFSEFYNEYMLFLKEGVCTDAEFKDLIALLLRFESSHDSRGENEKFSDKTGGKEETTKPSVLRSLEDYVASMKEDQTKIYYLVTSNRDTALASPYYESFRRKGTEVLFLYTPIDEFVMQAISQFKKRNIVSIESDQVDKEDFASFEDKKEEFELSEAEAEDLCDWLKKSLGERVKKVCVTKRLKDSPAIVTGHESASVQMMMKITTNSASEYRTQPCNLEINAAHPVVRGLSYAAKEDEELARLVAEQVLDNALISAGLLKDPRLMISRIDKLMASAMDVEWIEHERKEKQQKETSNAKVVSQTDK